ncbi:hypothetical protein [Brachybacterium sacelli]|uniref:hypothetical protein n=1 Tax=Brachybacterium sacelli TaxID=173364 RepID=UPI00361E46A0
MGLVIPDTSDEFLSGGAEIAWSADRRLSRSTLRDARPSGKRRVILRSGGPRGRRRFRVDALLLRRSS